MESIDKFNIGGITVYINKINEGYIVTPLNLIIDVLYENKMSLIEFTKSLKDRENYKVYNNGIICTTIDNTKSLKKILSTKFNKLNNPCDKYKLKDLYITNEKIEEKPNENITSNDNNMKVTEKDLIGDIKGFPIEVVEKMLEYQKIQNNKQDIIVFQKCKTDGFIWDITSEGREFWDRVISNENFNLFFEKYPKKSIEETKECKYKENENIHVGDFILSPLEVTSSVWLLYGDIQILNFLYRPNEVRSKLSLLSGVIGSDNLDVIKYDSLENVCKTIDFLKDEYNKKIERDRLDTIPKSKPVVVEDCNSSKNQEINSICGRIRPSQIEIKEPPIYRRKIYPKYDDTESQSSITKESEKKENQTNKLNLVKLDSPYDVLNDFEII